MSLVTLSTPLRGSTYWKGSDVTAAMNVVSPCLYNLLGLFEIILLEIIQHRHHKLVASRIYSGFDRVLGDVMLLIGQLAEKMVLLRLLHSTLSCILFDLYRSRRLSAVQDLPWPRFGWRKNHAEVAWPKHGLVIPLG
jgi:hypothetical protein